MSRIKVKLINVARGQMKVDRDSCYVYTFEGGRGVIVEALYKTRSL
jgi:hypothetical protein